MYSSKLCYSIVPCCIIGRSRTLSISSLITDDTDDTDDTHDDDNSDDNDDDNRDNHDHARDDETMMATTTFTNFMDREGVLRRPCGDRLPKLKRKHLSHLSNTNIGHPNDRGRLARI